MSLFTIDTNQDFALLVNKKDKTKKISNNNLTLTSNVKLQSDKDIDLLTPSVLKQSKCNEFDLPLKDWLSENSQSKSTTKKSSIDQFCATMGWGETLQNALMKQPNKPKVNKISIELEVEELEKTNIKDVLKNAVTNGIEKKETLEQLSKKRTKKIGKMERDLTKGKNWFNMPATEVTEEIKNDLEILQMRSVLDPKHFYKKNDLKVLPKYFQIGKVLPSPLEYYNDRGTKKSKKRSIAEELLMDSSFQEYNKRKYEEVSETLRNPGYYKALKKMKKERKSKR